MGGGGGGISAKSPHEVTLDLVYSEEYLQDLFHVYLNKFEFHFLRLHINKTNKFCFYVHNRSVPGNG